MSCSSETPENRVDGVAESIKDLSVNGNGNQLIKQNGHDANNVTMLSRDLTKKRDDYLNWSDYFMGVAFLSAMRSKDPCTQVGACIVNEENKIVGIGYNGMPSGCSDDEFPWGKDSEEKHKTKYMYVCHAEMNAILNKIVGKLTGCRIYVALFPCNECAKLIIQAGIKEVHYLSNKNWTKDECVASRRMFDAAGVKYNQYIPKNKKIVIDFESIDWNKDPQLPPSPRND